MLGLEDELQEKRPLLKGDDGDEDLEKAATSTAVNDSDKGTLVRSSKDGEPEPHHSILRSTTIPSSQRNWVRILGAALLGYLTFTHSQALWHDKVRRSVCLCARACVCVCVRARTRALACHE